VEPTILAIQARVLAVVGFGWLALGLWLGYDPITVTWRAAAGAIVAMGLTGKLLRIVSAAINDHIATQMAERQAAALEVRSAPRESGKARA
jgi:hypothetical protein